MSQYSEFWKEHCQKLKGKRQIPVCGRVSTELRDECKSLIDGNNYKTMNDVIEYALLNYTCVVKYNKRKEGGNNLGR